jgi:hypothetical protein
MINQFIYVNVTVAFVLASNFLFFFTFKNDLYNNLIKNNKNYFKFIFFSKLKEWFWYSVI